MFLIIKYPDLVQPGSGVPAECDDEGRPIGYDTRKDAEAALRTQYPGKSLRQIFAHAQKRVESRLIG